MKLKKVTEKEWMEMNEKEKIAILEEQGISYREAWELSESKRLSDLPSELLPLEILNVSKKTKQRLYKSVQLFVNTSNKPLHTAEIARQFAHLSHHQVLMALIYLMNDIRIDGRLLDVAKGIWIWWPKKAFSNSRK